MSDHLPPPALKPPPAPPPRQEPIKLRRRYYTLANCTRTLLITAAVLSVTAHVALAVKLYDQPLSRVDPSLLGQERHRVRVHILPEEFHLQPRESEATSAQPHSELQDLSTALLDIHASLPRSDDLAAPLDLRPVSDQRTMDLTSRGEFPVALPDALASALDVHLDLSAAPGGSPGGRAAPAASAASAADASAAAQAASAVDSEGASGRAERLLSAQRLTASLSPRPAELPQPRPQLDPTTIDQRLLQTPTAAPEIDFAGIVLQDTIKLDIPENLDDDFEYSLTTWTAPERTGLFAGRPSDPRGYFRIDITARRSLRKLPTMPKDVIFLLDSSSSISQSWATQMSRGVGDALATLNEGDRFNIVFFGETITFFSDDGPVPFTREAVDQAQQFLTTPRRRASTQLERAFARLLVRDVAIERVYNIVFISDGAPVSTIIVGEQYQRRTEGVYSVQAGPTTRDLINRITRDNDGLANIYSVGVGERQNRELLDFLAYRNQGLSVAASQANQAALVIRDLAARIRYPILRDIQFHAAGISAMDDTVPNNLPNLHHGETFSIFGRFDEARPFTMHLTGHNGPQSYDFTFSRDLRRARQGDQALAEQWAFWKLHHLYSEIIRQGETNQLKQQIDALRREYRLRTVY